MKYRFQIPRGAIQFLNTDDLATVRTRVQKWIDDSRRNRLPNHLSFTRPVVRQSLIDRLGKLNEHDIHFVKTILKERFHRTTLIKKKSANRIVIYFSSYYDLDKLNSHLFELFGLKNLYVKLFSHQNFLLFQRAVFTVSPIETVLGVDLYHIPCMESQVMINSFTQHGGYRVRTYIPVLNERTGIVSIDEKNITRKKHDLDSDWMDVCR